MPRASNLIPTYRLHKATGQAVITLRQCGRRHDVYLGRYNSTESRTEYARIVAEFSARPLPAADADDRGPTASPASPVDGLTINELLLAYIRHAQDYYRAADGGATGEADHIKIVCRHVRELYGFTPVAAFGPLALKAVRQRFIAAGWCRKTINQQTDRLRRVFKWAASEELVPAAVYHALKTVGGLPQGRTAVRESSPVRPVDDAVVDATLPHLNRHVRGLVRFQRLTGCRPGEACQARRCDIDTTGAVWLYRPARHKNAWRGKDRVIALGPQAQILVREFLTPDPTDYLFSPRRAVAEVRAERSADRKTPRYPSHMKRNATKRRPIPQRVPADRYDQRAYYYAVARACDRAFPPTGSVALQPGESAAKWWERLSAEEHRTVRAWRSSQRWHPCQLRHTFATAVRKAHGLEAAQVLLGHSKADVTQVYAERNEALAVALAATIG